MSPRHLKTCSALLTGLLVGLTPASSLAMTAHDVRAANHLAFVPVAVNAARVSPVRLDRVAVAPVASKVRPVSPVLLAHVERTAHAVPSEHRGSHLLSSPHVVAKAKK